MADGAAADEEAGAAAADRAAVSEPAAVPWLRAVGITAVEME
ncbi:hypothetical protein ABT187_36250 [Streptomyces sp. NPDC001817]